MNISAHLEKVNIHQKPSKKPKMRLVSNDRLTKWLRNHETDDYKRPATNLFYNEDIKPGKYKLSYSPGGKLVELKKVLGHKPGDLIESKRNIIDGYSRGSRNRFLKLLISIDYKKMGVPLFYTLTYPGEYSNNPKIWKRDLDVFIKRLERLYPGLCGTWRLEPQRRGAPHFSGFMWGCEDLSTIKGKLKFSKMWFEVVGSGDERHLRAGTGIEAPKDDLTGLIFYCSKYQAKSEKGGVPQQFDYPVGRYWGVFNREKLSISKEEFEIDSNLFFKIRRVLKRKLAKCLKKNIYRKIMSENHNGIWLIMSNEVILKLIDLIIKNEEEDGKNEDGKGWKNIRYASGHANLRCL